MPTLKRRINIELLLSMSATFLSLAALIVSIFRTKIAREQQQVSVWPYLIIGQGRSTDSFTFIMANNGVGPAIIRQFNVQYAGKTYAHPGVMLNACIKYIHKLDATVYKGIIPNLVLKAGDQHVMIESKGDSLTAQQLVALFDMHKCKLNVIYSDVYGNCWRSNGLNNERLDDCPPFGKVKF